MVTFGYDELAESDLVRSAVYESGPGHGLKGEVLSKLLPVGNVGGFRWVGKKHETPMVILTSTQSGEIWPDKLNKATGELDYFGDKKSPGDLLDTRGGNRILDSAFSADLSSFEGRAKIPVFLYFAAIPKGRNWEFCGLFVPNLAEGKGLKTVWKGIDGVGFMNYRAAFQSLDLSIVTRDWLRNIASGRKFHGAPKEYLSWLETGKT